MFGLIAALVFAIGFFVSDAFKHPYHVAFWLFIGLFFVALAVSNIVTLVETRRRRT